MAGNRAAVSKNLRIWLTIRGALRENPSSQSLQVSSGQNVQGSVTSRSQSAMVQCFPWPSSSLASKAKATMIKLPPA
jgi:hypothetical protein